MKLTFIRHSSLISPYDNYDTLSLAQLSQLARQEVEPSIDTSVFSERVKKATFLEKKYDAVFVSPSKRTQETKRELEKYITLPKLQIKQELQEIVFDPSMLATSNEFAEKGLKIIRSKLFKALVDNSNIETQESILKRLQKFNTFLHANSNNSVLVITHGFLLRYFDIMYRSKSKVFSEEALNTAINYDYLSGFTTVI